RSANTMVTPCGPPPHRPRRRRGRPRSRRRTARRARTRSRTRGSAGRGACRSRRRTVRSVGSLSRSSCSSWWRSVAVEQATGDPDRLRARGAGRPASRPNHRDGDEPDDRSRRRYVRGTIKLSNSIPTPFTAAPASAARVASAAGAGEVLVSRTVVDLVAGSGIEFDTRGEHALKGVPGEWRLFALRG